MVRRRWMAVLVLLSASVAGCERAHRYHSGTPTKSATSPLVAEKKTKPAVPAHYGWVEPEWQPDVPLQFVAESTNPQQWNALKAYWTGWPAPVTQIWPLEAAVAVQAQRQMERIQVKVPRGLPDPTPFIPPSNPPTLGKWIIGKRLFFDDTLLRPYLTTNQSCATCHNPVSAFTTDAAVAPFGRRNVPSLLNSVYNKQQFWDGRTDALEQVLLRQLEDELEPKEMPAVEHSPGYLHVFPGLVGRVRGKHRYKEAFDRVFGFDATADSIAKSLATYIRTLLSGDSVFDQAMFFKEQRKGTTLEASDFKQALTADGLVQLQTNLSSEDAAARLARGYDLFTGRARCSACHSKLLFTDESFHNIGISEKGTTPDEGRLAAMPYGLKDSRMTNAFKTPSLRNVARTGPYMHDGSIAKLSDVVAYYNGGIRPAGNSFLDPELLEPRPGAERALRDIRLAPDDPEALELFLRALTGRQLPAFLMDPWPK